MLNDGSVVDVLFCLQLEITINHGGQTAISDLTVGRCLEST